MPIMDFGTLIFITITVGALIFTVAFTISDFLNERKWKRIEKKNPLGVRKVHGEWVVYKLKVGEEQ